jgi:hypothetical protein
LHFRVGSAGDLAHQIERAATSSGLWESLLPGLPTPPTIAETVDELLALYRSGRNPGILKAVGSAATSLDEPGDPVAGVVRGVSGHLTRTRA